MRPVTQKLIRFVDITLSVCIAALGTFQNEDVFDRWAVKRKKNFGFGFPRIYNIVCVEKGFEWGHVFAPNDFYNVVTLRNTILKPAFSNMENGLFENLRFYGNIRICEAKI